MGFFPVFGFFASRRRRLALFAMLALPVVRWVAGKRSAAYGLLRSALLVIA